MNTCLAHPDHPAVAACGSCGADLCAACEVRAQGASWCEACFAARVHSHAPGQPGAAPEAGPPPIAGAPLKWPGLAAFFSLLVPGLGTIYAFNGPARRGLVQFAVWALLLWVFSNADGLLAFVAFVAFFGVYLWQAVDAHATARWVNALGRMPTEDEADAAGRGAMLFRNADSRSLGTALLVVGCVLLAFEVGGVLLQGLRWLLPLVMIGLGVAIVLRARRRQPPQASSMPGEQGGFA